MRYVLWVAAVGASGEHDTSTRTKREVAADLWSPLAGLLLRVYYLTE